MSPSDAELLERPIIILGSPRSGTSLLSGVIGKHRALAMAMEPRLVWRYGNDGKSDFLARKDARPAVVAHIRSTFARLVREQGKGRLVEKTPSNSLRPAFVDAVFPDCLFVHIVRHPVDCVVGMRDFWSANQGGLQPPGDGATSVRANPIYRRLREMTLRQSPYYAAELARRVAPSWMSRVLGERTLGPRLPGINQIWRELDLLEVAALQWRWCVEVSRQFGRTLPADRYLECRLEDLDPTRLRAVLDFCGLDHDPGVLDYFEGFFDPARSRSRRTRATPDEIERVIRWVEPTMQWLGYEAPAA
jgi:hypothetical protein